jgi:hypothetical protein
VINEGLDPFNESNSVRQLRVVVECGRSEGTVISLAAFSRV